VPSEAGNDRSIFFQSFHCLAQGCACPPRSRRATTAAVVARSGPAARGRAGLSATIKQVPSEAGNDRSILSRSTHCRAQSCARLRVSRRAIVAAAVARGRTAARMRARQFRPPLSKCHLKQAMIVRFFFKVFTAWRRAVLARLVRDARPRPQWSREVGLLRAGARGFRPPLSKCHLKQAMIVRFFLEVLTAGRKAVLACGFRDARSWPQRSREVGLLRECARGNFGHH